MAGGSKGTTSTTMSVVDDETKSRPVSTSTAEPCQFAPPPAPGTWMKGTSAPRTTGGEKIGPKRARELTISSASARSSGVKSMRSSGVIPCRSNGAGLVGNGCVGEYHSPGTFPWGTGRSSIGQTGSPVTRSKT